MTSVLFGSGLSYTQVSFLSVVTSDRADFVMGGGKLGGDCESFLVPKESERRH